MAMYGYIGLCRAVYVYVWLCMAVHGYVELCMAMDVGVCLCSRMYARIDLFVQITRDVSWGIHGLLHRLVRNERLWGQECSERDMKIWWNRWYKGIVTRSRNLAVLLMYHANLWK